METHFEDSLFADARPNIFFKQEHIKGAVTVPYKEKAVEKNILTAFHGFWKTPDACTSSSIEMSLTGWDVNTSRFRKNL